MLSKPTFDSPVMGSVCVMVKMQIVCERDEVAFIFVSSVARILKPILSKRNSNPCTNCLTVTGLRRWKCMSRYRYWTFERIFCALGLRDHSSIAAHSMPSMSTDNM